MIDLCGICHGSWDLQRGGRWEGREEERERMEVAGKMQEGGREAR